jgi:hypothetical protein
VKQIRQRSRRHTERRTLLAPLAAGETPDPRPLVRDSSRRITTMRFRPANIRVINRRDSRLDRCLTCFTEKKEP